MLGDDGGSRPREWIDDRRAGGIGVFLGDRSGTGRTFQQVADGPVPALGVAHFVREAALNGAFREMMSLYAQASLLQTMQCTACNALHDVTHRCCRWLLQTHDRVDGDDFLLKQEFLAIMLGVRRPTVTVLLAPGDRTDFQPVWSHARAQTEKARSGFV